MLLSHGRALYSGSGLFSPSEYFASFGPEVVPAYPQGYNVADYLLEVASDPHVSLFQQTGKATDVDSEKSPVHRTSDSDSPFSEKGGEGSGSRAASSPEVSPKKRSKYATLFLTQLQVLAGREWKILRRWVSPSTSIIGSSWAFLGTRRYFLHMCPLHRFSASFVVCSIQFGNHITGCSTNFQVVYISIRTLLSLVSNPASDACSSW